MNIFFFLFPNLHIMNGLVQESLISLKIRDLNQLGFGDWEPGEKL